MPCNTTDPSQRWRFLSPGLYPSERAAHFSRRTLSALVNDAFSAAVHQDQNYKQHVGPPRPNSTNGTNTTLPLALTLLPETDSRYGVNHIGAEPLVFGDVEVACTSRGCDGYFPSQMWYYDTVTGQLMSGNYTASINEQWLTSMVPAPARRCLTVVPSADMAGTPARDTEVWGGPLTNGSFVVALQNRQAPNDTAIHVPISLLFEPNNFFSFAMTASAKALGFARQVPSPPTLPQFDDGVTNSAPARATSSYIVRDVLAQTDLSKVDMATGVISASVDAGDTRLFVLRPDTNSSPAASGGQYKYK